MPEPFSADHLQQLRQRWERDPKSRAFLQLAEEYRRAGRLADAVHVLQAGLKEHPNYLSAQVALGRCMLESGVPQRAAEVLERAVSRDPTQLVANKLLVEAYLAQGQATKARERLDLYKLFNDRDPEIEPLENRIRALEGHPPSAAAPRRSVGREAPAAALFELPAVESLPEVHLERSLPKPGPSRDQGDPFGDLHAPEAMAQIEAAFVRQGIFTLAPALAPAASPQLAPSFAEALEPAPAAAAARETPAASAPFAAAQRVEPETALERTPPFSFEPVQAPYEAAGAVDEPEEAALAPGEVEPEVEVEPPVPVYDAVLPVSEAPKAASSTLGELYLAQGHLQEAEESFHAVLRTRPGDPAALAGLESVRQHRGEAAAGFDEEIGVVESPDVVVGGLTARKASLLRDYLARIRRGAKLHVS